MRAIERERFIVPKETFMRINRKQLAVPLNVSTKAGAEKRKLDNTGESRGANCRGRGRGRGRGRPRKYL